MGGNATLVPACGACICCTAIFLSIFFAVNLPEIRRNTVYQYTECTVTDVRTIPFRACSVACSCSDCVGCPSCSGKWAVHESRDKYNLEDEDIEGECNDGYTCCRRCCETCTRCTTTCSRRLGTAEAFIAHVTGHSDDPSALEVVESTKTVHLDSNGQPLLADGMGEEGEVLDETVEEVDEHGRALASSSSSSSSKKTCRRTCRSYSCNCYCCQAVNNERCSINCEPHYETRVTIQFRMRGPGQDASDLADGDVVAPTIIKTHGAALAAAELYLASPELLPERVHDCWYDPAWSESPHISDGELIYAKDRGWTAGKWVLLAFPSLGLLLALMALSTSVFARMVDDTMSVAMYMSVSLWCGFIIPVCIFLPVAVDGALSDDGRKQLGVVVVIMVFIFLGLTYVPMLKAFFKDNNLLIGLCIVCWVAFGIITSVGVGEGSGALIGAGIALPIAAVLCGLALTALCRPSRSTPHTKFRSGDFNMRANPLETRRADPKAETPRRDDPKNGGGLLAPPSSPAPPPSFDATITAPSASVDEGRRLLGLMQTSPPSSPYETSRVFKAVLGLVENGQTQVTRKEVSNVANKLHLNHPHLWSTQVAMAYGHVLKELADRERANSGNAKAAGPTVL